MLNKKFLRLNIGCGPFPLHPDHQKIMDSLGNDWILIDKYIKQPLIKNFDAQNLPYKNNSVDTIYSSHLLEHLPYEDIPKTLKHWYTILKKGGEIYLNVPDLEWSCRQFLKILKEEARGLKKNDNYYNSSVDYSNPHHGFLQIFYGMENHEGEFHRSGFTKTSLINLLTKTGFSNLKIKKVFEAHEMVCLIASAKK